MKRLLPLLLILWLTASCSSYRTQIVPNPEAPRNLSIDDRKKAGQIEICFDGTANDWSARTNVRRRFEVAAQVEDPSRPCLYIEGVGTNSLSGKAFGVGMKARVLTAYKFLARNWRPAIKDTPESSILVFGFSRGAFQARMLTGLLAHCGLPRPTSKVRTPAHEENLDALAEEVWDYCEENLLDLTQDQARSGGTQLWKDHLQANQEKLQAHLKVKYPHYEWVQPKIKLLAIWDTVPGLSFTKLSKLGEPENGHQRYKIRPYPNIQTIVHALALDDRRSKFEPLTVGPPLDPAATNVYEVWFPGAHSDVGGGYGDSNDMAGTSYNWLHRIMIKENISQKPTIVYSDAKALMHHPEDLLIHKLTSKNLPRKLPANAQIDHSAFRRADGETHPEENRREHVLYTTSNPILNGPGKGQILDVSQAGKSVAEHQAYLGKLGLVFHHDDAKAPELALPEKGAIPLSISQMAAAWNHQPKPEPSATPPAEPPTKPGS
jgi:Uncharacterized alpha/beta hydrolase domain (DUF2235)